MIILEEKNVLENIEKKEKDSYDSLCVTTYVIFVIDCLLLFLLFFVYRSFEPLYLNIVLNEGLTKYFMAAYMFCFMLIIFLTLAFFIFSSIVIISNRKETNEKEKLSSISFIKMIQDCFKMFIIFVIVSFIGLYMIRSDVVRTKNLYGSYALQDAIVNGNDSINANVVRTVIKDYNVCNMIFSEEDMKKYKENLRVEDILELYKKGIKFCDVNHVLMNTNYCSSCGLSRESLYLMFFGTEHLVCGECMTEYTYGSDYCSSCGEELNLFKIE